LSAFPSFGFDINKQTATIYGSGTEPLSCTTIASIGKAVAASLEKSEETRNRWVKIFSAQTSQYEILHALEKRTGKSWKKSSVSISDVVSDARIKRAQGDFVGEYCEKLRSQS
jgi:hypothetical protein